MVKFCLKKGGFGGERQSYHIVNKVYYRSIIMEAWLGGKNDNKTPTRNDGGGRREWTGLGMASGGKGRGC